jgi:hypothetical protein
MHGVDTTKPEALDHEMTVGGNSDVTNDVAASESSPTGLGQEELDLLRMKWFSLLGEGPCRNFSVPFDEMLEHIEDSFDLEILHTDELRLAAATRIAENFEDLILAIACTKGDFAAWSLLERDLTPLLARMCELRVDETDALLHSSRFLCAVRTRTRDEELLEVFPADADADFFENDGTPCLQDYTGLHPLRSFLGGPLFANLQDLIRDGLVAATRSGAERDRSSRCLRLAD